MLFSVIQIPFCVVVGWMMGQKMDLNFQLFETATLFITVLVVAFMLQVGRNWTLRNCFVKHVADTVRCFGCCTP